MPFLLITLLLAQAGTQVPRPSPTVTLYSLHRLPEPTPAPNIVQERFGGAIVREVRRLDDRDAAAFLLALRDPSTPIPPAQPFGVLGCVDPGYGFSITEGSEIQSFYAFLRCRRLQPMASSAGERSIHLTPQGSRALAAFFCKVFPEDSHACDLSRSTTSTPMPSHPAPRTTRP